MSKGQAISAAMHPTCPLLGRPPQSQVAPERWLRLYANGIFVLRNHCCVFK
jgi:hypothetical protein